MKIEYSNKDIIAIILLSSILLILSFNLVGIEIEKDNFLIVVISILCTITLHEIIHIVCLKLLSVKFKVKLIKFVAIQIDYDEMQLWQYYLTALSPQILTLALLLSTMFVVEYVKILLMIIAIFNFASSSGDFYGILKTLVKARGVRGKIIKVGELQYNLEIDKRFK